MTKFGTVRHGGQVCFYWSAKPLVLGVPVCQKFLGTPYMPMHGMKNSNQILHGDQTVLEKSFYRSTTPPALARNFCDTNAYAQSCLRS